MKSNNKLIQKHDEEVSIIIQKTDTDLDNVSNPSKS